MPAIRTATGYSADVRLHLQINGCLLKVAQVGEGFLVLRDTYEAPPQTEARVIIRVDDEEVHHPVILPDGIVCGVEHVDFIDLEDCPVAVSTG